MTAAAPERPERNQAGTLTVEAREKVALDETEKIRLGPRGDDGRASNEDRRREELMIVHAMTRPPRPRDDTQELSEKAA
jgi:hypothetical protein